MMLTFRSHDDWDDAAVAVWREESERLRADYEKQFRAVFPKACVYLNEHRGPCVLLKGGARFVIHPKTIEGSGFEKVVDYMRRHNDGRDHILGSA